MTETTRDRLAHALWKNRCERNGTRSRGWSRVVAVSKRALLSDADAILDELLEPGEGALQPVFDTYGTSDVRLGVLRDYRAIITAIKAGT